ncbi:MAG: Holliday junction branch migration protein RuvA [Patescibacteria group bacterium]
MIASLTGTVSRIMDKSLVLDVNGVGYVVFVLPAALTPVKLGQPLVLHTHLHVREDAMELYGFPLHEDLEFFALLLQVTGVGPKSALNIMSLAPVVELKRAIANGDETLLTKVSGIGKKTAGRLILELRSKLEGADPDGGEATGGVESQAIDGLVHLGYSAREAREALRHVGKDVTNVGGRVRAALKLLGKKQ